MCGSMIRNNFRGAGKQCVCMEGRVRVNFMSAYVVFLEKIYVFLRI